ncbi:MAG: RNA polymerase sigma factor [Christensenellales bacterium]|jgi:DNA-directed RNA polymerase specialized sigma24 family protein
MNERMDELRLYFARVKPVYRELFGMAHAICGDYERAEYALQRAILEGFLSRRRFRSARGFRDSLKSDMRRIALNGNGAAGEITWDAFAVGALDRPSDETVRRAIEQEDAQMRRAIMLRYGCDLRHAQIARVLNIPQKQAQLMLTRFERRLKRRMNAGARAGIEARLSEVCLDELTATSAVPDAGAVYRTFEAEASGAIKPGRAISKLLARAAYIAAILLLALIIWIVAAVIRPARIVRDELPSEVLIEQQQ